MAGGASGLVAIARELGGDDRVVSVVQYLRVALVTATIPLVVTLVFHADRSHPSAPGRGSEKPIRRPGISACVMLAVIVAVGAVGGRWVKLPGAGLLGPLALTVALQLTGLSFGLAVPVLLVQAAYMVIGWQAGIAFTRESLRAIGRILPLALTLIVVLGVATAGLGVVLADVTGMTQLEGYLATSPGGVYAVLATAVETGSNVTFIVAAQVLRVLLMLFVGATDGQGDGADEQATRPGGRGPPAGGVGAPLVFIIPQTNEPPFPPHNRSILQLPYNLSLPAALSDGSDPTGARQVRDARRAAVRPSA